MLSGALAENEIMFQMDQVFMSDTEGTIHYNLYVPESYDGTVPYALYMALPAGAGCISRVSEATCGSPSLLRGRCTTLR